MFEKMPSALSFFTVFLGITLLVFYSLLLMVLLTMLFTKPLCSGLILLNKSHHAAETKNENFVRHDRL